MSADQQGWIRNEHRQGLSSGRLRLLRSSRQRQSHRRDLLNPAQRCFEGSECWSGTVLQLYHVLPPCPFPSVDVRRQQSELQYQRHARRGHSGSERRKAQHRRV